MSETWKQTLRKKKTLYKMQKLKKIAQEITETMTLTTADMKTLMVHIKHCQNRKKQKRVTPQKCRYDRYDQPAAQHSGLFFDIP